ncbi:hypothetical protein [Belnapia sp. F-4-1]|uniref:hypothetical protein n=1 Tax=Belnapia sp. F-4-1 TaxID=1545443 RepID=UPI0005B92A36|nr:hypothetical protein [Belnapia sp. F-4-1]
MDEGGDLVPRLETLFGGVWQAALDHAGVLSRRRARDIGAGDGPSGALRALVEMLETTPVSSWPERWWGLGKVSETCPTLTLFPARLVEGCMRPEDAVLVWDVRRQPGPPRCANVAIGYLPQGCLTGLPRDDAARTRWRLWYSQWDECHGAPASSWMTCGEETPEGMVAGWMARDGIDGDELDRVLDLMSRRLVGFSRPRVYELAEARTRQVLEITS